jgi:hypothetical protein
VAVLRQGASYPITIINTAFFPFVSLLKQSSFISAGALHDTQWNANSRKDLALMARLSLSFVSRTEASSCMCIASHLHAKGRAPRWTGSLIRQLPDSPSARRLIM